MTTTMTNNLDIGQTVFVVNKLFIEGDRFKVYVAAKEINRIERTKDSTDIIYTAGKRRELRFHELEDGTYATMGDYPKTVYLNKAEADAARDARYAQEIAMQAEKASVASD